MTIMIEPLMPAIKVGGDGEAAAATSPASFKIDPDVPERIYRKHRRCKQASMTVAQPVARGAADTADKGY